MSRYTYTLNQNHGETAWGTYKQSELEKMTTFHLRELCRKEKLIVPSGAGMDREVLIRLLMRFRGQKEFRHIKSGSEGGLERLEEYIQGHEIKLPAARTSMFRGRLSYMKIQNWRNGTGAGSGQKEGYMRETYSWQMRRCGCIPVFI